MILPQLVKSFNDYICDALPCLVSFVQFRKREKHPSKGLTFSKVAGCNFKSNVPSMDVFHVF